MLTRLLSMLLICQLFVCICIAQALEAERIKSRKASKLLKITNNILNTPIPSFMKPDGGKKHNPAGPAVFTAAFNRAFPEFAARLFTKTLRNTGYNGDIVLGVHPDSR